MKRYDEGRKKHSVPSVAVQVPDIGYCIPGIVYFCNKSSHLDCVDELETALRNGGRVVSTSYWAKYYEKKKAMGVA
jgi:hypothetical protein